MTDAGSGQVAGSAAEMYEKVLVPALFGDWVGRVLEAIRLEDGQHVLDVGCGTGGLARQALARVAPNGSVVGVDPDDGMLWVARSKDTAVEWRRGRAEALPFEADRFDVVVSKFALMFFEDPAEGVREMARVGRPSGRVVVAVWDDIENAPGYAALAEIIRDIFGDRAAATLRAPFALGDVDRLDDLFARNGLTGAEVRTEVGAAWFPSIRSWMTTDVGYTLAGHIGEARFERLVDAAETELTEFVRDDGRVEFDISAHIIMADT